jgi:deoxyguanosine kinase
MNDLPHLPWSYLCIEGNIGAGKTSLARRIAHDYNARLVLEEFEDNSFLPKFYQDPDKYAFPLELSFMAERFQQMVTTFSKTDLFRPMLVSDYFFDKSLIFGRKTLDDDLLRLYRRLFDIMSASMPRPELLVYLYLGVEQLQENIRKRGREYERGINLEYLQSIQESYLEYLKRREDIRIVILDTTDTDFVVVESDYSAILELLSKDYPLGVTTLAAASSGGLF